MSRGQRIGLLVAAVVVAVAAFVIAKPDSGDDTEETPAPKPEPDVTRISVRAGQPVGGPARLKVRNGEQVRLVVTADAPEEVHVHGYDLSRGVGPGKPAQFSFTAELEGSFEIELEGSKTKLATLTVQPK